MSLINADNLIAFSGGTLPVGGASPGDLAAMRMLIRELARLYQVTVTPIGDWAPGTGAFPAARPDGGAVEAGDQWNVRGAGIVDGEPFAVGDVLTALRAGGGATYSGNWSKQAGTATAADQVSTSTPGITVAQALSYSVEDVQALLNSHVIYADGDIVHARSERVSFRVAPAAVTDHDSITAGGVKLYRLRRKRIVLAYSQSNFAGISANTAWQIVPGANAFVWNGGNCQAGEMPQVGDAFVPAAQCAPQVPIAYLAELAAAYPEDDWYLVILARGGTGIRAMVGHRYAWSAGANAGVASRRVGFNADLSKIYYSETDLNDFKRFSGRNNLGDGEAFPARLQTTLDGGARWIEFTCQPDMVAAGGCRSQSISVTDSHDWLVADGEDVTIFPAAPRMDRLMTQVMAAAFAALKLPAESQKIDKLLIWPTESDINYPEAYQGIDFNLLLAKMGPYLRDYTDILMTLPWPYGVGIEVASGAFWDAIRALVAEDPDRRTLVSLEKSGAHNWGDSNNVHVIGTGREMVGRLMRKSEQTGGTGDRISAGFYVPTVTGVLNVGSAVPFRARWVRTGSIVTVSGGVTITPMVAGRASVQISLPIPSRIVLDQNASGVAVMINQDNRAANIRGYSANNTALLTYTSSGSQGSYWSYNFSYEIRPMGS